MGVTATTTGREEASEAQAAAAEEAEATAAAGTNATRKMPAGKKVLV